MTENKERTSQYDPLTRSLHLLMALGVTTQLLSSLVMVTPKPGRLPNLWWDLHEKGGIAVLGAATAYWIWVAVRAIAREEPFMLFPWFSRHLLSNLRADIVLTFREARQLRLPGGNTPRPLPSAIQGLGLLGALFLASTGAVIALSMDQMGSVPPLVHDVKELHEAVAPLMWAYLVVHPLLGLLHQVSGHRCLNRMFGL